MNHSNFGGPYPHPDDERQWGNLLQGLFGFGNWGNQPPFGPPGQGGRPPGPPFGPPSGGPGRPPFGRRQVKEEMDHQAHRHHHLHRPSNR